MFQISVEVTATVQFETPTLQERALELGANHPFFNRVRTNFEEEIRPDKALIFDPSVRRGSAVATGVLFLVFETLEAFVFAVSVLQAREYVKDRVEEAARSTFQGGYDVKSNSRIISIKQSSAPRRDRPKTPLRDLALLALVFLMAVGQLLLILTSFDGQRQSSQAAVSFPSYSSESVLVQLPRKDGAVMMLRRLPDGRVRLEIDEGEFVDLPSE